MIIKDAKYELFYNRARNKCEPQGSLNLERICMYYLKK